MKNRSYVYIFPRTWEISKKKVNLRVNCQLKRQKVLILRFYLFLSWSLLNDTFPSKLSNMFKKIVLSYMQDICHILIVFINRVSLLLLLFISRFLSFCSTHICFRAYMLYVLGPFYMETDISVKRDNSVEWYIAHYRLLFFSNDQDKNENVYLKYFSLSLIVRSYLNY